MRIIGITCPTEDGSLQTVLIRSSNSLQNSTVRKILPWFFTQAIPLFDVLSGSCVVIRLQTETDPFRHLRRRQSPPFDGKGFNLQRSERHGGFVCIDEWLRIPIEDFNQLCPGFFYGTVKYPNLNILLSQRRFRQHVVNGSKLWAIMYDCLLCRQFNERQQTEGDFKQEMRRKYFATQLKDFHPEIAELEERIEMSNKYSKLKNSLQQMIVNLHAHQVQRYKDDIKQLKLKLREAVHEKEQLLATRAVHDHNTTVAVTGEIAATSMLVRKNELENLLAFCEAEQREAKANLELRNAFETSLDTLKAHFHEMETIVDQVDSIRFLELELESVRCSIDNNQSFLILSKISNDSEKGIYICNLRMHKQSLKIQMASAQEDVNRMKRQKSVFIDQMQTLKDLFNVSTAYDDTHQAELVDQLQHTIVKIVETTATMTTCETKFENLQQKILQSYLEMSTNVPFAELVSIAAVKLAIEILDANLSDDFLGFVYERALEAGIRTKWCEGLSCSAIFRSMNGVTRVKQLMEKKQSIKPFQYIVLETRVRTNLNNFLSKTVPEADTGMGYEETVAKVNTVVQHMVEQLRAKRELNATGEILEQLTATKEELLAKLDDYYTGSCIQWPRTKLQELPSLVIRTITAKNHHIRLRARYNALERLIHQIEGSNPLPNADALKLEESRLNEQLKTILQQEDHNKKSYYKFLNQLTKKCDTMQFTLQRYEEDFCSMSEGLSSTVYEKLIACWTTCSELILRTIPAIEDAANQFVYADEVPPAEINDLNEQIQSLDLREKALLSRITCTESILEDYQRENNFTLENRLSHFSLPRRKLQEPDDLLNKIVATQNELQQIPPGCSSTAIAKMKNKLNRLQLLERHLTEVRELCLNNLILPIIDKLHVQKMRQICQLFSSVSEDLPELGVTAQVFFEYEKHSPEYEEPGDYLQNPFSLHGINSIHIHTSGEDLLQGSFSKKQRQLSFLVLFISFLYCDGCKLLLLDKAFEQLFDCGIVTLMYVLEKHFPTMQVLILDKK
ncbi:uncharacterized protein LOC128717988 [Anopheles marshallii]|uniref:uncharacterized protein LOC128717988 n=1 Tax=Anopheles marshallii TaxID=1521116 RepID=UPI00237A7EEB|nr:uncharacterized protein LOC128717988 [Anopheles marshallii]